MAKFTLICEDEYNKSKITFQFETNNIHSLLPEVETFIRASGYSYLQGNLDFVEPDFDVKPDFDSVKLDSFDYDDFKIDLSNLDDEYRGN